MRLPVVDFGGRAVIIEPMVRGSIVSIMFAAVLGAGLVSSSACKKAEKVDPLVQEVLGKLKEFRDKGCACTTLECATKVQNDLGQWMLGEAKRLSELDKKATPAQNAAGQKLSDELNKCAKELAEPPPQPK